MASKSLGTLTLDLVAKIGGFEAGMDKASRKAKKTGDDITKSFKYMGVAVAAGTAAAVAGLSAMVKSQLASIDAQAKMAQRLRTTYESLTTLGRAGELAGVGMQQIEVASRSLDINLGKATRGVAAQADAFAKLKLSADTLAKLPLDERIKSINVALKENVSETERASVAADIFGSRGAAAIQQLDPATIEEAARQTKIFGLNLSEIDAAKVELANDALSTFGLLSDGIGAQLTVELAPILKEIGDSFLDAADRAGGLGSVVQDTTRDIVSAAAVVVNVVDGFNRVFDTAISGIVAFGGEVVEFLAGYLEKLLYVLDGIPGIDLSAARESLTNFAEFADAVSLEARARIEKNLNTPLAGDGLKSWYSDIQEAAEKAAASAVSGRNSANNVASGLEVIEKAAAKAAESLLKAFKSAEEGFSRQIALIDATTEAQKLRYEIESGNLVGINDEQQKRLIGLADELDSIESMREAQKNYQSLIKDLRTDEEKLNDQLSERLATLNAISDISAADKTQAASRIAAGAFVDAPAFAGLAPEVGGAAGELIKLDAAQADLEKWYSTQLAMLEKYRSEKSELNAQWDDQELALKQEHEDRLGEIEKARQLASLASAESLFGNLADLTGQFAGEQSAAFKAMFILQKSAAIAQSLVAIQAAIAQAAASGPFPSNIAAMASVAAATAGLVANIQSVALAGQAHDGIDSVPASGTWNLQKGERVSTAKTSAKLDRTLSDVQMSLEDNRKPASQNLRIVNAFDTGVIGDYMGSGDGEQAIMNVVRRNQRTIKSLAI